MYGSVTSDDFTSAEHFFITPIESCGSISGREGGNYDEKNLTVGELAETKENVVLNQKRFFLMRFFRILLWTGKIQRRESM